MPKQGVTNRALPLMIIGAVLVTIALGTRWFLENYSRRPIVSREHMSVEARRNPFLALTYFLKAYDYQVEAVVGRVFHDVAPAVNDVVILNNGGAPLGAVHETALWTWLQAGGQLIVAPTLAWDPLLGKSGEKILDRLGTALYIDRAAGALAAVEGTDSVNATLEVALGEEYPPARVEFEHARYLVDHLEKAVGGILADGELDDEPRYHLLRYAVGAGHVTVLSDNGFLKNTNLKNYDNAYFARYLLSSPSNFKVWLLYDTEVPSLIRIIMTHASAATIAMICLLIGIVAFHMSRFGRPVEDTATTRRDIMEHLDASANYLWRVGEHRQMIDASRAEILRQWSRRDPSLKKLSVQEQVERLADLSGYSSDQIQAAFQQTIDGEIDLVNISSSMQRLQSHTNK